MSWFNKWQANVLTDPWILPDLCLIQQGNVDRFHSSLCVYFHLLRCVAYLLSCSSGSLDPSIADTRERRINSTEFCTEQTLKQQHNIWLISRIKHSNRTNILKKRQIQTLPLILRLGTLTFSVFLYYAFCLFVIVFITQSCDSKIIWMSSPGSAAPCYTQSAAGGGWWMMEHWAKP